MVWMVPEAAAVQQLGERTEHHLRVRVGAGRASGSSSPGRGCPSASVPGAGSRPTYRSPSRLVSRRLAITLAGSETES